MHIHALYLKLRRFAGAATLLLFLMLAPPELAAQTEYRGYEFDSTLHLGAHIIPSARLAKDSLLLDFGQYYGYDIDQTRTILGISNSTYSSILSANQWARWDYSAGAESSHGTYWKYLFYSLKKRLLLEADTTGFKLIYNPLRISDLADHALAAEHYVPFKRGGEYLQYQVIDYSHWYNSEDRSAIGALSTDSLQWVVDVPSSSTGTRNDALVAGEPKYAHEPALSGFHQVPTFRLTEAGISDSSTFFRISFTISAGSAIDSILYPSGTKIGYVLLYQRSRLHQSDCKCNVFAPLGILPDTLWITKDMYQTADTVENARGYREIGWWFNNRRGSVLGTSYQRIRKIGSTVVQDSSWLSDTLTVTMDTAACHRFHPKDPYRVDTTVVPATNPPDTSFTYRYRDSLDLFWVPVIERTEAATYGDPYGGACVDSCAARFSRGLWGAGAIHIPDRGITAQSDFDYRFYSTRIVPMKFLRSRVNTFMFEALKAGRLDTLIRKDLTGIFTDATLRRVTGRLGFDDEMQHSSFPADRILSEKMQDLMWDRWNSDRKQLFTNPLANMDGSRILSGDILTRRVKIMPVLTRQSYFGLGSIPMPIYYANPDSMDAVAKQKFYQPSLIAVNTDSAYRAYVRDMQERVDPGNHWGFGRFRDHTDGVSAVNGPLVPQLVRAVDVSRFKYAHLGISNPVWTVIQTMGKNYVDSNGAGLSGAYKANGFELRIPTPEEITAQTWLSVNCGATGFIFGDIAWDGYNLGLIDVRTMEHSAEYASLLTSNGYRDTLPLKYPKMWVGQRSRFDAIRSVALALRDIDTAVGFRNLEYRKEQMSLHDTAQYFTAMPMVDTLYTRKARLHDRDSSGVFLDSTGSGAVDPRSETFLELTHFRPGARLADQDQAGVRFLLLTNRRTWPVDERSYSSSTTTAYGGSAHGLGAIDVRRPIIVLKNNGPVIADSLLVEKVLDSTWRRTVAVGTPLELDWLRPGWGEMYRVTPVRAGLSMLGTAYNNAVRSVILSDTARRAQVVIYERDSIVWGMIMDSLGNWSREFRVSDTADASASGRTAVNMFPAIAVTRNGTGWLAVWERMRTSDGKTSVEGRYWPRFPHPDSLSVSSRLMLASARPLTGSYRMTPAVVGIDSGFVVAWATPTNGIETIAVPNRAGLSMSDVSVELVSKGVVSSTGTFTDSLCQFPTLAYVRNDDGIGHMVHLAWQQSYNAGMGSEIFYQQIRARFPTGARAVMAALKSPEDVNINMAGCTFAHPCVAADSVRVGVAFESIWPRYRGKGTPSGGVSVITLRFRDSVVTKQGWRTLAYYWGDDSSMYRHPVVTEFPMAPRATTGGSGGKPEGALAWFRVKGADTATGTNQIYFYRFGKAYVDRIRPGQHPSLTLAPLRAASPFLTQSSLLVRDAGSDRFLAGASYAATNHFYVDGILINHPSKPDSSFTGIGGDSIRLFIGKTLRTVMTGKYPVIGPCGQPLLGGGIKLPGPASPNPSLFDRIHPIVGITEEPDLPPSYFASPEAGATFVETLEDALNVSRTSVFLAGNEGVILPHTVYGSDELVNWLDTQPHDSIGMGPADVRTWLELVRATDGVVLWRGDTVTARDVADSSIEHAVTIPVDIAAPLGTQVYVRMPMRPTPGMSDTAYGVSAGFFAEAEPADPGYLKPVRFGNRRGGSASPSTPGVIATPNPAGSHADLRIEIIEPGTVEISLYDMAGSRVLRLPAASAERAGVYAAMIDVSSLPIGAYVVRVRAGTTWYSGRIDVMR